MRYEQRREGAVRGDPGTCRPVRQSCGCATCGRRSPTTRPRQARRGAEVQMSDVIGLMAELAPRPGQIADVHEFSRGMDQRAGRTGIGIRGAPAIASMWTAPRRRAARRPPSSMVKFLRDPINGTNAAFALTYAPDPAGSLSLYRNGILQKQSLGLHDKRQRHHVQCGGEYRRAATRVVASYRVGGAASLEYLTSLAPSGADPVQQPGRHHQQRRPPPRWGPCTIPAGTLQAGDRIEIRADYGHSGTGTGFSYEVKWGAATLTARSASASGPGGHGEGRVGHTRRRRRLVHPKLVGRRWES